MCGITGYLSLRSGVEQSIVTRMTDSIAHRGPDSSGIWLDQENGVALGHRRLAIIELSAAGHQPMTSPSGRFTIVYNGEVYNYMDIRKQLEAAKGQRAWVGHSDTEVIVNALQHWGVAGTLRKMNGMFALAIWDRDERVLYLARDRLGEKPLYYGWMGQTFLFGSELKALVHHPDWRGEIDRDALCDFVHLNNVPAPRSIYKGIRKLLPGTFIRISAADSERMPDPVTYWSLSTVAQDAHNDPFVGTVEEAIAETELHLVKAVHSRMAADVPLGAFLSGGIDSSIITALMQTQSSSPVQTFTIGYEVTGFNEAEHAKEVAAFLGTSHTELYLKPKDVLNVIPHLAHIWDEPFADSSQLPTLLLSQLTKKSVTVSLSGDAGDEFFAGYNRYGAGYEAYNRLRRLPRPLRAVTAKTLAKLPAHLMDAILQVLPTSHRPPPCG